MAGKAWGFTPGKKNQIVIEIADVSPEDGEIEVTTRCDIPMQEGKHAKPTTPAEEIAMAVVWFINDYLIEAKERQGAGMVVDMTGERLLTDGSGLTKKQ